MAAISRLNDTSDHGGYIISASPDVKVNGVGVAREGDLHSCPLRGHGVTAISAITTKTRVNGRLVITVGALAGCGATITSGSPNTDIE
jgi:uncharacterized Zn-binding protein involved in type VI secretion